MRTFLSKIKRVNLNLICTYSVNPFNFCIFWLKNLTLSLSFQRKLESIYIVQPLDSSFRWNDIRVDRIFTSIWALVVGIVSCMFLFTAGCAVKVPPVATYVLTVPTNQAASSVHPRTQRVLLVNTMTADPGYKTDSMIYVTAPAYLRPYAYHAWVAPPAAMLTPLIIARIESKQYFRAVVTPPFFNASDYRLDTRLIVLQQEFLQPVSQVRCGVQALLTNSRTGRVIASRQFQAVVAAPGNNPASGVAAANQAADQISEQIAQFVVVNTQK